MDLTAPMALRSLSVWDRIPKQSPALLAGAGHCKGREQGTGNECIAGTGGDSRESLPAPDYETSRLSDTRQAS